MSALFTQPGAAAPPGFTQPGVTTFTAPTPAPVTPVFEHPPTSEQADILDAAATGNPLVIEAGAGTGKTSTLKMVAASTMKRGLYLAYNRAIAEDARGSFPHNVHCATAHSLAFQAVGRSYAHRLNGPRLPARETARLLGIPQVLDLGAHALTAPKVARIVMDAIKRFCYSDDDEPHPYHVAPIPGLEGGPEDVFSPMLLLRREVEPFLKHAWEDLQRVDGRLKFEHDHYLKMWALTRPTLPAELVFLDEAQDANPLISRVVEAQAAQRILVGDQSQAIYGWRGAVDAMQEFAGQRLVLSQSFRFGPRIADEANEWLDLLGAPLRLTGNPSRDSRIERIPTPAAVLCRTNAGAIGQAIAALGSNLRPALVGGGDDIRRLAEACRDLRNGRGTMHPELMAFASWAEVQDYAEHDAGGQDLKTLVKLIDSYGPDAVIKVVDQLVDEHNATIIISTAHKAKGREWATVRLAADFAPPYDKDGDLIPAEAMLTYVAVTRAKQGLDPSALPTHGGETVDYQGTPVQPGMRLVNGIQVSENAPLGNIMAAATAVHEPADRLVPDPEPISTDLPPAMVGWLNMRNEASRNEKQWKEIKEQAETKLKEWLGDREEATVNGRPAISWKTSKPGTQLDGKRLEKDHPDIYATYLVPKKAARPFKILEDGK